LLTIIFPVELGWSLIALTLKPAAFKAVSEHRQDQAKRPIEQIYAPGKNRCPISAVVSRALSIKPDLGLRPVSAGRSETELNAKISYISADAE
jgi:hypothetical protein